MSLGDYLRGKGFKEPPPFKTRPEILLCPNIPMPMSGVAPRVVMGQEWWDEVRRAAYRSTMYRCLACGVRSSEAKGHEWLEAHELYDLDYLGGRMVYVETVPLCHYCHSFIHDGRLYALYQKGEITFKEYQAVIDHGKGVLKAAGLKVRPVYSGPVADWGEWRMVLGGVEYPPRFRTFEEWDRHFNRDDDE